MLFSFLEKNSETLAIVRLFPGVVSFCLVVTKKVTHTCDKLTNKEFKSLAKQKSNLFKNDKFIGFVLVAAYNRGDELIKAFLTSSLLSSTEFQSSYIKDKAVVTVEDAWDKSHWFNPSRTEDKPRWNIVSKKGNTLEVCRDSGSGSINGGPFLRKIPGGFFKRETTNEFITSKESRFKKNYILTNSANQNS